ncbi:MAG: transposase, partial [Acetobacteraceae bacterium]
MCLHALAKDRNQTIQFGRFLDNEAVSAGEMLTRAGQLTGARVAGRHVLAIQDTTEINFATHVASKRGFGIAGNGRDLGLFLHPLLAVDAGHGGVIGLLGAQVLNRTAGPAADRKTRAADHKESRRWLSGAETAGEVLADAAMITVVGDRESDIYDQFARRPANVHLLTRAAQDRTLEGGVRLFGQVGAWEVRSRERIDVPPRGPRAARE